MVDGVFLTEEQRLALEAQRIDMERHNVWRMLSQDGTNGWKYRCMCSKCSPVDVRED